MSVGLLIITHGNIGQSIYDAATHVMDCCPIRTKVISLTAEDNRDVLELEVSEAIIEMDHGQGVLILTDMYGATPSNVACQQTHAKVQIVAGLNLPMLLRVLNYPSLSLTELMEKAVSGGKEGILHYEP